MKPFLLLFVLFPLVAFSQLNEHFDDGNFNQNPKWTGTQNKFRVDAQKQLQLYDSVADTAWLSTPFHRYPQTEWQVWAKVAFSPSSNNFVRIFLSANSPDLTPVSNGYYLQLGERGSNDAIELFRKSDDTLVSVCRGTEGLLAKAFAIRIKVTCDSLGNWQLFADPKGGDNFRKEAEGKDDFSHSTSSFFGFYCQYSRSYAKKFFFDDIYAGPPLVDTLPPVADSVFVSSDSTLVLFFNENIDSLSAMQPGNYKLLPDAENPAALHFLSGRKSVALTFSRHFKRNRQYKMTVSGIKDDAGNQMTGQTISFVYVHPLPYDVVFNEIMADPVPVVKLPGFEYLELYNRLPVTVDLAGWQLKLGKSTKVFGKATIAGGGYLILCKEEARDAFSAYGPAYGFKSFSLTNSGEDLKLFDRKGHLISSVQYAKSWYNNKDKSNGGWSLEQVNPANICSGSDNWKVAGNQTGGTPGKQNSVFDTQITRPEISKLQVPDDHSVVLTFTQKMDSASMAHSLFYKILPNAGQVEKMAVSTDNKSVKQVFAEAFDTATIYTLTVLGDIQNCMGTAMAGDTAVRFGLPQKAGKGDVVINEVLFYPLEGGVDYVELYNRSQKTIDLSALILGTVRKSPPNPPDSLFYDLSFSQNLLLPGTYVLLTSSPEKVKAQYTAKNPGAFLRVAPFPAFGKEAGSVLLYRQLHKIDAFDYSEKMQYPLLTYTQGVSLERVSADGQTNDANNWHSAAESAGFGTPGYRNSQSVSVNPDSINGTIDIEPDIFSPDNDGYQDVLHVKYKFETSGNTLTINIFNISGQLIRRLVNNEYTGTDGVVSWDGLKDDGTKAPVGIYVLYIEVFDQQGKVMQWKKTAVLATKL